MQESHKTKGDKDECRDARDENRESLRQARAQQTHDTTQEEPPGKRAQKDTGDQQESGCIALAGVLTGGKPEPCEDRGEGEDRCRIGD